MLKPGGNLTPVIKDRSSGQNGGMVFDMHPSYRAGTAPGDLITTKRARGKCMLVRQHSSPAQRHLQPQNSQRQRAVAKHKPTLPSSPCAIQGETGSTSTLKTIFPGFGCLQKSWSCSRQPRGSDLSSAAC